MAGRPFHILCIGRLKQSFIQEGCQEYLKRLKKWRSITYPLLKEGDAQASIAQRKKQEGMRIEEALPKDAILILLDERGQEYTTTAFANLLARFDANGVGSPSFIVGGAFGVSEDIAAKAKYTLALSQMTLPHELARLVLFEQLYRAETILHKTPYHHS
ncbi:MAG: 23S rRNA (pseudouridine(1915)-N(3))-methyltransferase RlmH [Desulfovibrio sp.]|nr:23S rRNA (pseudouridine(1915)-N(3))-methyltransferase RlmH [Desulfovibrio sp.]